MVRRKYIIGCSESYGVSRVQGSCLGVVKMVFVALRGPEDMFASSFSGQHGWCQPSIK